MTTDDLPEYLSRQQAAAFLTAHGLIITTYALDTLAHVGEGPRYRIFGRRAVYHKPDLMTWARSRMTEPRAAAGKRSKEVTSHA